METDTKTRNARLIGSLFFGLMGAVNLIASYNNGFRFLDIAILILGCLPLLINKRIFYIMYGGIAACMALYMGFVCFYFSLNPYINTPPLSFFMGFLLAASMLFAALCLVYAGMKSPDKNRFTLI